MVGTTLAKFAARLRNCCPIIGCYRGLSTREQYCAKSAEAFVYDSKYPAIHAAACAVVSRRPRCHQRQVHGRHWKPAVGKAMTNRLTARWSIPSAVLIVQGCSRN
jgi:hypothetical protein